jgi:hypothetical protein
MVIEIHEAFYSYEKEFYTCILFCRAEVWTQGLVHSWDDRCYHYAQLVLLVELGSR